MNEEQNKFSRLKQAISDIESEVCCMEHPLLHVLCMRNIGHKGQHWFTVRWQDVQDALEQGRAAIRAAIAGEVCE